MMALTKADMLENLRLLIQQLSRAESVDQTLQNLLNLAQEDLTGLAFVNYVNSFIQKAADQIPVEDLTILINAYCQSLEQELSDNDRILRELIHQADQLEQKTSIYPTASDGFENLGEVCATKLDELFILRQSGGDITTAIQEAKKMAASFGMLRLLAYIDRLEDREWQQVRTLLLQGQEYRIGASEELGELLESTTLSATAKDWGVEEFLVNPLPPQDNDEDIISFIDQEELLVANDTFNSLFDDEEPSEGIKTDLFDAELADEQLVVGEEDLFVVSDTFNSLFDEDEEPSEGIKTDLFEVELTGEQPATDEEDLFIPNDAFNSLFDDQEESSQGIETDLSDAEAELANQQPVTEEEDSFVANDTFSLFDEEDSREGIKSDLFDGELTDDQSVTEEEDLFVVNDTFNSLFNEEEESSEGVKTDLFDEEQIAVDLDSIDLGLLEEEPRISQINSPDFEDQSSSKDIEEEQIFNLNDIQSEANQENELEFSNQDDVDIDPFSQVSSSGSFEFNLFEEEQEDTLESVSAEDELPIGYSSEQIIDIEESLEGEELILAEDSSAEIIDSEPKIEILSGEEARNEDPFFEFKDDQLEIITDESDVFNIDLSESADLPQDISEMDTPTEELRLETDSQSFDENDVEEIVSDSEQMIVSDAQEVIQTLPKEERQDVTEILDTFSVVTRRTTLVDLGLSDLVIEAIGGVYETIDYADLIDLDSTDEVQEIVDFSEPDVSTVSEDRILEEFVVSNDDVSNLQDLPEMVSITSENLTAETYTADELTPSLGLVDSEEEEEDLTVLQGVPEFFGSISPEFQVTEESEFGFLEETPVIEEVSTVEEPIVDEEDYSFLDDSPIVEEVSNTEEPIVTEEDFSFLEETPVTEEVSTAEEPIVAEEDFSFLEETPVTEEVSTAEEPIVDEEDYSFLDDSPIVEEVSNTEEPIVSEEEFSFLEETPVVEEVSTAEEPIVDEEDYSFLDDSPIVEEVSNTEEPIVDEEDYSFLDDSPVVEEVSTAEEPIVDEEDFSFLDDSPVIEQVSTAQEPIVDEEDFSFLEETPVIEELSTTEEPIVSDDDFSFLEESPVVEQSTAEEPIVSEEEFSFLEETPVIEEVSTVEEPSVDEEEFSFLEETPVIEEVSTVEEPSVDEEDFSFLESVIEEELHEAEQEEPIDSDQEDMTVFQDVPAFFEEIEDSNEVQQEEATVDDLSIDDLLADLSQPIQSPQQSSGSLVDDEQQDNDDRIDSLLSEISNSIPSSNLDLELEEENTTIQEAPEFFSNLTSQAEEDDDANQELDELLSDLDQNSFNIRQYDQDTEVINLEQIIDEGESLENELKAFTDDNEKAEDATDELSKLLGDMSDEDLDELANTFSQEDGDDSGFFFFQGNDRQVDDSEISLIELFNGDSNSEAPEDVLEELEEFLEGDMNMVNTNPTTSEIDNSFDELEALLADDAPQVTDNSEIDELESLLSQTSASPASKKEDFSDLDALLGSMPSSKTEVKNKNVVQNKTALNIAPPPGPTTRSTMAQNMRVDVRYLDNINNLVGELIVNRNLLQQDQIRLQTSLGNLFNQIHKLNDVAQRVRDEFDRSLLERSLQATLDHRYLDFSDSGSGQIKTIRIKDTNSGDALTRLDEHDELNNLALDIIELITRVKESASDVEFVIDETQQVSRQLGTITSQIEDDLKQVRMEPFSEISDRLPKQVRDLALKRKKQADIEISGRETMIDKAILQGLNTPINHLITNALVHGIEEPEVRTAAGKDPKGKITVKAYHQGNETIISITDDGGGINPEKVRQSAISKGLLTLAEARLLSDQDTYSLLFRPGFSTKAEVDEEGGRGVGLDAVITQLNSIKGSIQVESAIGKGTTFTIRLPLTLSISKAMVCLCNRNRVAFPVDSFEDVVEITQDQVFVNSNGQTCFLWRDMELPFRPLSEMLSYNRQIGRLGFIKQDDDIISIIILRSERNFLALQVDKFDGEIEIVIKQVDGPVAKPPGIAGVTVLGDGRVMAICNVLELFGIASGTINVVKHDLSLTEAEDQEKATTVLVVDDSVTMRKALVQTFEKAGYRVEEARNGKEAWDKLRGGFFCDLIFSDVEMPQMNGFQLLEKLQKDEELSRIPVAMLTSQGKRVHIENAKNLGAKAYFVKAYTDQEVLEGAERLLRGQVAGKILEVI